MRTFLIFFLLILPINLQAEVININQTTLANLLQQKTVLVDVRRPEEWQQTGVLESSHQVTFFDANGDYDAKEWLASLGRIVNPDEPLILICHQGVRSKVIANWLSEGLGYATVYNVSSGMDGWLDAGNPVVNP